MSSERWQEIETLFHLASGLPEAERGALLDHRCGDDDAMRREVESLLAADAQVFNQLERTVEGVFSLAAAEAGDEPLERQRIGPYRVLRELGRGGLSTVFLGQRDDEDFPLKVAIKVVKRGMDTQDILRRLRQERRILASLDHPNISRMMDGGSTEDGLPYFIMEYIEGQTIEAYCESQDLDIDQRLELFTQVCGAVHYAHQSLIVHRDIKPGNLMVTQDGIPKLLDFGIAKLMAPDSADTPALAAATATAAGLRLFTPEYASPEQVRGQPLTTATDVYSLGVLLHRLLTGVLPYEVNRQSLTDIERVVCEQAPERPSALVARLAGQRRVMRLAGSPDEGVADGDTDGDTEAGRAQPNGAALPAAKLARRLRGDLDNIVLMALRKEPQRRYASAQQLADDLRRHREGLPVAARRDTVGYRASKFIRRNRWGVLAASLLFVSLLAGMLATMHQARLAQREKMRAERHLEIAEAQQERAERVSNFLVDVFEIADPGEARGNEVTARELLDKSAERIAHELEEEPEVQSAMMDTMGTVYRKLGLYPKAESLLRQALTIRQRVFGGEHLRVAESLDNLGSVERIQGNYESARQRFDEALRLRRQLLGNRHPLVAESLNNLAVLEDAQGNYDVAESLFNQALTVRLEVLGENHPEVAETLNNLAVINYRRRRFQEAEPLFRRALEIRRNDYKGDSHPRIATTLSNLAAVYQELGRLEDSEKTLLEVVEMSREMWGEYYPGLGTSLSNLSYLRRLRGDLQGAAMANREAMEIFRRTLKPDHPNFMTLTYNSGEILRDLGEREAARGAFEESLALRRQLLPPDHLRLSYPLTQLGRLAFEEGDLNQAKNLLSQALRLQEPQLPQDDLDLAETRAWLGLALVSSQPEEAVELIQVALWHLAESGELRKSCLTALAELGIQSDSDKSS